VGDFNGDGKQDLATANDAANVSILLGNGAGGFAATTNFGVGTNSQTVAVGDFNGDGKPDLATANNTTNVFVLLDSCGLPTSNTIVVTNTSDSGAGSLRQAILDSNATAGTKETITFNIAGAGLHTISPASALPDITDPLIIDGYTQPGSSVNTSTTGSNAVLLIELDGAGAGSSGLSITGGGSTVRGLVINRFSSFGIAISGAGGNTVAGNFIGTNAAGTTDLGNGQSGVFIEGASNNLVGGLTAGAGNVIAFNSGKGIAAIVSSAVGNAILSNSIHDNGGLGVDLNDDGVTANDANDADAGPNNLQNFPVLTAASAFGANTKITGTLNSTVSTIFKLQFFSNAACDASGNGEGRTFLGSTTVTTDSEGNAAFNVTLAATVAATEVVTSTATDPAGNTSEFSACQGITNTGTCGTLSFAAATNFGVGSSPRLVAAGDFNGDGKQDLAVPNLNSNNVSILLGDGTGIFGAATNFAVGSQPPAVAVGDFNGDGKQDLTTANFGSANVSVLLGDGAGSFGAATNFAVGTSPISVALGDFNGDGKQDIAVANFGDNNVSILLGNGAGSFGAATNFAVGTNPTSVAVGDFNGDGKPDLATANPNSNNVSVLLGNGAGSFGAATNFTAGNIPASVAVGDFNGDGKQDIATADSTSNDASVLLGDGAGSFAAATSFAVGTNPFSVAVGDFNGDGKQDLAVANRDTHNVSVLLGNGAGSFGAATNFAVGAAPNSVAVSDFNGDGKPDLATPNKNSDNVSVLLGNCTAGLATDVTWISAVSGNWSDASKWQDGTGVNRVPGAGDNVFINVDGTYTVTLNVNATINTLTLGRATSAGTQTLSVASTTLNPAGSSVLATGIFNLSGGAFRSNGTFTVGGVYNWSGGNLQGTGTTAITSGGQMILSGASDKIIEDGTGGVTNGHKISNAGVVTWTGTGRIAGGDGSVITNQSGGLFDVQTDSGFILQGGNPATFDNLAGATLRKSAGAGATGFGNFNFSNAGTLDIRTGSFSFTNGYAQTAGTTTLNGGNLSAGNTITLQGGTLAGAGTVTANVNNNGGTVAPGFSPGCINISGNYTQGAGGSLNIEVGGATPCTQFDRLAVTGAATLDGALSATLINGFVPTAGQSFQVMTFASRAGTFATVNGPFTTNFSANDLQLVGASSVCVAPPANMVAWYPGDGNANDIQGGNNGSLQNGATFAAGEVGQAFSFDGVDDQVVVPHNANQNTGSQITIDAWVNPSSLGHGRTLLQKRSAANIGGYVFETTAQPLGNNNGLQWVIMIGGVFSSLQTPANVLTVNAWQHVAATYDGATMRIFVNGVEVASKAQTGAIDATTDPLVIGRNVVTADDWQGLIDEVELYNRALSPAEIQSIVNAGSAGKCKPSTDITITNNDSPDPVVVNNNLTYTITATNTGPDVATGVAINDPLPAGVSFVSATPSQGTCSGTSTVNCGLGSLASGASATVQIVVTANTVTTLSNTATVSGIQPDPNGANNSATATTTVLAVGPTFSISGHVADPANLPLVGVNIHISGSANGDVTTDTAGNYTFANLPQVGNFTLTPTQTNFRFAPASTNVDSLHDDQTGVNFAGTFVNHTITGRIVDEHGNGLPGVTVTLAGSFSAVTHTDALGNFSFTNIPENGSFVVTPEKEGFTFNPAHQSITGIVADVQFQSVGAVQPSPTPTPDQSDDFSGGPDPDPDKWVRGILTNPPPAFDPLVRVFLAGGLLHIQPRANADGLHYSGLVSVRALDLNSTPIVSVEVVQAAQGAGTQTIFGLGKNSDNWFRFAVVDNTPSPTPTPTPSPNATPTPSPSPTPNQTPSPTPTPTNSPTPTPSPTATPTPSSTPIMKSGGTTKDTTGQTLLFEINVGGQKFSVGIAYDPAQQRFWRFRHDAPAHQIIFETSPDAAVWTERFRATLPADQTQLIAELSAGTFRPSPAPVEALFDNFLISPSPQMQFSNSAFNVLESAGTAQVQVIRTGNAESPDAVDFATSDGTAHAGHDYTATSGTLVFGIGERLKTINIPIINNSLADGSRTVNITLSNPIGGRLGSIPRAVLTILDDDQPSNPIDQSIFFVTQHYLDFLGRQPDPDGLQFWVNNIEACGANQQCREVKLIDTSAAFFLSIEFQQTGYIVDRFYLATFGRPPKFSEYLPDLAVLRSGVIIGQPGAEDRLAHNKQLFAAQWVARPEFKQAFDKLNDAQYVDTLAANAGLTLAEQDRTALVVGLLTKRETRPGVLLKIIENDAFVHSEFNPAFVRMEYFGYLRRDTDAAGFNFWLAKLNRFNGEFHAAEMVKAFISSVEYRSRFGQP
jgi:uncharacterized repeat protein (TIGR01451 family)